MQSDPAFVTGGAGRTIVKKNYIRIQRQRGAAIGSSVKASLPARALSGSFAPEGSAALFFDLSV
jgi:hypothetical protein